MTLDNAARHRGLLLALAVAVAGLAATLFLLFSAGRGQAQPSSMSMPRSQPKLSAKVVVFHSAWTSSGKTTSRGPGW
jgi:hypothetical protein